MLMAAILLTSLKLLIANASLVWAEPRHKPWEFTAQEIEVAYRYQQNYGKSLRQPLNAAGCLFGVKSFSAVFYGKRQRLPCHFITETLRHLQEILQAGAARYLFPLDLNHAHLAVPKTSWREKYSKLPSATIIPAMLHDPQLVALYHSAEHLKAPDPQADRINPAVNAWREKRNILGFYDGRPIKILPPRPDGAGVSVPKRYWSYGGFEFLSSRSARLAVILKNRAVTVDIRLELSGDEGNLPPEHFPAKR